MSDLEDWIEALLKEGYEITFRNYPEDDKKMQIELQRNGRYLKVACLKDLVFSHEEWSLVMELIMVKQQFEEDEEWF